MKVLVFKEMQQWWHYWDCRLNRLYIHNLLSFVKFKEFKEVDGMYTLNDVKVFYW